MQWHVHRVAHHRRPSFPRNKSAIHSLTNHRRDRSVQDRHASLVRHDANVLNPIEKPAKPNFWCAIHTQRAHTRSFENTRITQRWRFTVGTAKQISIACRRLDHLRIR
jgi:hypothetical protein